ncbi:MAG: M48 family metalloprotease [Xanthomonadales bacterium]|nr:M48 family metalloprotease [Xanthomonadales bacterium]
MKNCLLALLLAVLTACQVNPVTGERNLQFYDSDWEQQIGASMYAPMRQSQGGDFKLDADLTQYVQSVGQRLAQQARRKDELQYEFRVLNDSTPNAWALPGGKIAINRGLLTELDSEAELAAVLGHVIVHCDAAHGARAESKGMLTQIGAIAGMVLIDSKVDSSAGKQAAAIIPAIGAQLINTKYGRDAERESDYYGMQYMSEAGYNPQGAVELQETFVRLSEGRPDDWLSGLFASHPPSRERVELNRETAAALPEGGDRGEQRYQQATRYLREVKPAYDAYDAALKLAGEEKYDESRAELVKAMKIEPREALFHALDGDLHAEAKNTRRAFQAFDRAVDRDPEFFYHLLRRGQLALDLGRKADARADLQASIDLLPTARGHYLLGNLDRDDGELESARAHYEQAAQSDSETGAKAERELILMDISNEPGKYVATGPAVDNYGRVYCLLGNRTRVNLSGIQLNTAFVDDQGSVRRDRQSFSGVLEAGQQDRMATAWSTSNSSDLGQKVQCEVAAARVVD